jgi:hypothetical protein
MVARLCIANCVLVVAASTACERQHTERRGPAAADTGRQVASAAKPAEAETKTIPISTGTQTQELRNWKDLTPQMAEPGSARHDWGIASGVKILWAGDLNGDAALDLLLKQGDAEIGVSMELYLSSGGASAPRLTLADRFDYGAC